MKTKGEIRSERRNENREWHATEYLWNEIHTHTYGVHITLLFRVRRFLSVRHGVMTKNIHTIRQSNLSLSSVFPHQRKTLRRLSIFSVMISSLFEKKNFFFQLNIEKKRNKYNNKI